MVKKNPASHLLDEETALADASEAANVFLHELGNVLNNLLLSAHLLQRQLAGEPRTLLGQSCQLINSVAGQMQQLAKFRQCRRSLPYLVDVQALAREVLQELVGKSGRVLTSWADAPVTILAIEADIRRVIRLLLQNALAVTGKKKSVKIESDVGPDQVRLMIEDEGPPIEPGQLLLLFEPFQPPLRPGQNHLELAICKNLARRTDGQLDAEVVATGGLRFSVRWPRIQQQQT